MADRFELMEQIGKGGMGTVWKARDRHTGDIVALKLLHEQYADDPAFVARFEREVDVTSRIDSPYVVKMLGYGIQGNRPYVCMEYVPGESLRDVLRRVGPLIWDETKLVLRQVAAGLRAAHEAGVVHRDVKPSNILLAPGGVAKLVDFGIAKAADLTALTGASTTMGTAGYMAPEGESTPAADMYALGCTAHEMLTGATPFTGDSPAQVLLKHLRDEPDVSKIPLESREVVGWLLEKNPDRRLNTASRLLLVVGYPPLQAAAGGQPSLPVCRTCNAAAEEGEDFCTGCGRPTTTPEAFVLESAPAQSTVRWRPSLSVCRACNAATEGEAFCTGCGRPTTTHGAFGVESLSVQSSAGSRPSLPVSPEICGTGFTRSSGAHPGWSHEEDGGWDPLLRPAGAASTHPPQGKSRPLLWILVAVLGTFVPNAIAWLVDR